MSNREQVRELIGFIQKEQFEDAERTFTEIHLEKSADRMHDVRVDVAQELFAKIAPK